MTGSFACLKPSMSFLTVGTMAPMRLTSLPRLAPKPPGSAKSRCMSMTISAIVWPSNLKSKGRALIVCISDGPPYIDRWFAHWPLQWAFHKPVLHLTSPECDLKVLTAHQDLPITKARRCHYCAPSLCVGEFLPPLKNRVQNMGLKRSANPLHHSVRGLTPRVARCPPKEQIWAS